MFDAAALRTIRQAKGLSQTDLGAVVGRSSRAVARWESGAHEPSGGVAMRIAAALRVPLARLYTEPAPVGR